MTLTSGYCLDPHTVFEIMTLYMPGVIYAMWFLGNLIFYVIKQDSEFEVGFHTLLKVILESTDFHFYINISNINVL